MTTLESRIDTIEEKLRDVCLVKPFKKVMFGDLDVKIQFPSIYFILASAEQIDLSLVNTTMRLGWELAYDVNVLHAGISGQQTMKDARRTIERAVEIFINQMPESKRLDGEAWWINPESVDYGILELPKIDTIDYVYGGVIRLIIKICQNVS